MQKYLTKREKESHIAKWQESGLSRNAYAKKVGINPRTFMCWTWLWEKKKSGSFVEIPKKLYNSGVQEIVIEKKGMKILLPATIDAGCLKNVFAALGGLE